MLSWSEKENQPDEAESATSEAGRQDEAARRGSSSNSFSLSPRQQTNPSLPPGRSARRILLKAAMGSAKNITPKRENAASNEPVWNGYDCTSPQRKVTFFGRPGSRRATSM